MEELEIKKLWTMYDKRLNENLVFNTRNAEQITHLKIQSVLSSMKPVKFTGIVLGILWVWFLGNLISKAIYTASYFFLVSAGLQVLVSILAIGIYVYQVFLINNIDITGSVLITQEKLAKLRASTLLIVRLILLVMPVFTTFYLTSDMFIKENTLLWVVQSAVTMSFTFTGIWLFIHINYENRDKKWFKLLFSGREWNPIIKSSELLAQIKEYRIE